MRDHPSLLLVSSIVTPALLCAVFQHIQVRPSYPLYLVTLGFGIATCSHDDALALLLIHDTLYVYTIPACIYPTLAYHGSESLYVVSVFGKFSMACIASASYSTGYNGDIMLMSVT